MINYKYRHRRHLADIWVFRKFQMCTSMDQLLKIGRHTVYWEVILRMRMYHMYIYIYIYGYRARAEIYLGFVPWTFTKCPLWNVAVVGMTDWNFTAEYQICYNLSIRIHCDTRRSRRHLSLKPLAGWWTCSHDDLKPTLNLVTVVILR